MTEMAISSFACGPEVAASDSFSSKYCQRFQCPAEDYERDVLWRCMVPLRKPLARLVLLTNQGYFDSDIELITELKHATSFSQVREIINCFSAPPVVESFARRRLKIRMSKAKLLSVANALFHQSAAKSA